MSLGGRQMQRSGAGSTVHHQRQHSDNFIDSSSSTGRWIQTAQEGGTRMSRNVQRGGGSEMFLDPSSSPNIRSSSLRMMTGEEFLSGQFPSGLLDIHSFDTELLSEMSAPSLFEKTAFQHHTRGKSYDDFEPYSSAEKLVNKARGPSENNLIKSFAADKEKANNVAKIKVVVRKRPLNKKEIVKKEDDIITIEHLNALTVHETKFKVDLTEYVEKHDFVFDAVLDERVSNEEVYSETVQPIVPLIFRRTKATCFAYGQTGSGKTFTMQPLPLKAAQDILRLMQHNYHNQGFQLYFSFFEIYGGKLYDLLGDRRKLCMREDGKQQVCIVGLQEYKVSDVETIRDLIEKGSSARSTGTTGANEESSRSHAILQLVIKRSADGSESKPARPVGKLSFIDLAGSERGADTTDNDKQTRMEGAEINKSLLALKECIRALDNDQGHIPFRGSKLTEVLRDSFVGDSRTVMISCISPGSGSCEHTLNTLRYADRVKSLSKGNNSKKETAPSFSNLRESTTLPLPSVVQNQSTFDDGLTDAYNGKNRFGWQKQREREPTPPSKVDRVPSGREESKVVASLYTDYREGQIVSQEAGEDEDYDYYEEKYETPARLPKPKDDKVRKFDTRVKGRNPQDTDINYVDYNDELDALLKEEEDLVTAHRKQVEETMEIVREEMNLLVEADKPGTQLDDYISKLNAVLEQKATSIMQLQTRLAGFQKRLNDHNVLVSSAQ
ncbi:hypothetical protein QQ045_001030 [Rhodiola kirilowii]